MKVIVTDNSITIKSGDGVEFHGKLPISGCFRINFIEFKIEINWADVIPHELLNTYQLIQVTMSKKVFDNIGDYSGCPFPNVIISVIDNNESIYKIFYHNEIVKFMVNNRADKSQIINKIICWMADKPLYHRILADPDLVKILNFTHIKIYGMYEAFINYWGYIPDAYITKLVTDVSLMEKVLPKLVKYSEFVSTLRVIQPDMGSLTVLDQMLLIHRNKKITRILLDGTGIQINRRSAGYYHIPEMKSFLRNTLLKSKFDDLFY